MAAKLYAVEFGPPSRAVLLTAAALDLELQKDMDPQVFSEEFLKKNPQHTVPTLEDDDFVIWDSHAIITYLVSKYAQDDSLYPKDFQKRAIVDQRLHFESGVIFPTLRRIMLQIWKEIKKGNTDPTEIDETCRGLFIEGYDFLNKFLEGHDWVAGDSLTVADFSLIATITSNNILVPIDAKFTNVHNWIKRCEQLPYYNVNEKGLRVHEKFLMGKLTNMGIASI